MAFWDALKKSLTTLPGDLYKTGQNAVSSISSLGNTLGQTAPFMAAKNAMAANYARQMQTPKSTYNAGTGMGAYAGANLPQRTPQSQVGYGISGSYGGGAPIDYYGARARASSDVNAAYDPLRKLLENEMNKGIPDRYGKQAETAKGQLPLNQRKYESMLALLEQSTGENKADILGQEDTALGAERARAGARGLYDSSVLAGGEQRIAKDAMTALTENERNQQLKAEGYNTDYKTADQSVFDYLASLYNQQEGAVSDVKSRLLGIPADALGAIQNEIGGMVGAKNANTSAYSASKSASSSANKGDLTTFTDEATGETHQGYFDPITGQLIQDIGVAPGLTGEERATSNMSKMLENLLADGSLSSEEVQQLTTAFPFQATTIKALSDQYKKKTGPFGLW